MRSYMELKEAHDKAMRGGEFAQQLYYIVLLTERIDEEQGMTQDDADTQMNHRELEMIRVEENLTSKEYHGLELKMDALKLSYKHRFGKEYQSQWMNKSMSESNFPFQVFTFTRK